MKIKCILKAFIMMNIGFFFIPVYTSMGQDAPGIVIQTATLNCSAKKAFSYFTENKQLESWLTVKAIVEPEVWGKYELFWDPANPELNSTIGCKILAIEKNKYINFEWKGPEQFNHFMNKIQPLTNVTVIFAPHGKTTQVTLMHTGWKHTAEWEEARLYFVDAWKDAFKKLEAYVNEK